MDLTDGGGIDLPDSRKRSAHRLDAIVTLTANPASLTGYVPGDNGVFHTSGPSAVAGYPAISVPAGQVSGLPVGLSFPRPGVERAGSDRPGVRVRAGVAGTELAVPAGHRADHPCRSRGEAEITCAHGLLAWRKHS
jgi:hypothetical protein